ncbi:MAG: hypothetical protein M1826_003046 [Phylliscum demangeonii]|nr:MAG: hypothetical protein M1826_003046 [Phylliscum demangeonii]
MQWQIEGVEERADQVDQRFQNMLTPFMTRHDETMERVESQIRQGYEMLQQQNETLQQQNKTLQSLAEQLGRQDKKIDQVHEQLVRQDKKMDRMDRRLVLQDEKIDRMDRRLVLQDEKIDRMDRRLVLQDEKMERLDERIHRLDGDLGQTNGQAGQSAARMQRLIEDILVIASDTRDTNTRLRNGNHCREHQRMELMGWREPDGRYQPPPTLSMSIRTFWHLQDIDLIGYLTFYHLLIQAPAWCQVDGRCAVGHPTVEDAVRDHREEALMTLADYLGLDFDRMLSTRQRRLAFDATATPAASKRARETEKGERGPHSQRAKGAYVADADMPTTEENVEDDDS